MSVQTFCASGCTTTSLPATYTPTSGTHAIIVEVLPQGGGGGGAAAAGATQNALGGSGGAGAYAKVYYPTLANFSGATVTIGTTGAGGTGVTPSPGTPGGTASFILAGGGSNASVSCPGGAAGAAGAVFTATTPTFSAPSLGGAVCTIANGTIMVNTPGQPSGSGISLGLLGVNNSGVGGSSVYGAGAIQPFAEGAGTNGLGFGAGGGGAASSNNGPFTGGNPSGGLVVITELR